MPFEVFRGILCHKNNSVLLETYSQSNIEQLDMSTVTLGHKDKMAKCIFYVVPADDPVWLGIPDIELLNILKIICEVVGD